jgi:hypothetical protein
MEPFVGTGADPGFNSNNAPTNPNYWPFGNTCEADEVSPEVAIGGLQDTCVYNQRKCKMIPE